MNSYYNARTMYHMILVDTIFILGVFTVSFYFYVSVISI